MGPAPLEFRSSRGAGRPEIKPVSPVPPDRALNPHVSSLARERNLAGGCDGTVAGVIADPANPVAR